MDLATRIETLITPALKDLGCEVVEILLVGSGRLTVEISIERIDREPVTINDCVKANREISALMDVEDPIKSAYTLEVSSPGIDRPLVKKADYKRFEGQPVKVKTYELIEERKRFRGVLTKAGEDTILLECEEAGNVEIGYEQIQRAKLNPQF